MGFIRDKAIDRAVREVDALATLLQAVNVALTALEERVKALENADRLRQVTSGNRRGAREFVRE